MNRIVYIAIALMMTSIPGCLEEDAPPLEEHPPEFWTGTWKEVFLGPYVEFRSGTLEVHVVEDGFVMVTPPRADKEGRVPGEVLYLRDGASDWRLLFNIRRDLAASTAADDTVYLFTTRAEGSAAGLGSNMGVTRVNVKTGEVTRDPIVEDDRSRFLVSSYARAVVMDHKIYLFGGCCVRPAAWSYDLNTHEFRHVSDHPDAREEKRARFMITIPIMKRGDEILVGPPGRRGETDPHMYSFNPATGEWTAIGSNAEWSGRMLPADGGVIFLNPNCGRFWNETEDTLVRAHVSPEGFSPYTAVVRDGTYYVYGIRHTSEPYTSRDVIYEWSPPDFSAWPPETYEGPCYRRYTPPS